MIFYDYFYPGYRGGGPIQSLANLVVALEESYEISVVTGITDLQTDEPYKGYKANTWNAVLLPGSKKSISVYYADRDKLTSKTLRNIFREVVPAVVYLNGLFSLRFFILPIWNLRRIVGDLKIVVCPRGMLQSGALAIKPLKKRIYLTFLALTRLLNKASWHATNQEEASDIQKYFPKNKGTTIAANIPKAPYTAISKVNKKPGELKLIYLSLIAEKKNLLLLLELIKATDREVVLHIYGPITDYKYWNLCKLLIDQMPHKVEYKGEVLPANVQQTISGYHAMILLTKGENFGHAIYESLSVGRPVLTSNYTPWKNLEENQAGVNLDILRFEDCQNKLHDFLEMNQEKYDQFCMGAHNMAVSYFNNLNVDLKYKELFS